MNSKPVRLWPDSATILERSRCVFFAQWEELLRLRRVVIKSADPHDIHDLRVASRRFRAVLELFYPFLPKGPKTELRKNVRVLTRILGGLRNIDEAQLFFQARFEAGFSGETTLVRKLAKLRVIELERIKRALKAFDHRNLDRMVREMVSGVNETSIKKRNSISLLAFFSDVSIRRYLPIHRLLTVSTVPTHHASRHALRIAIKKWRYFFEIITQILQRDYTSLLEHLKEYQSILGCMNDIAEFKVLLENMKLSPDERGFVELIILEEDKHLLERFTALIERSPLNYTFLI